MKWHYTMFMAMRITSWDDLLGLGPEEYVFKAPQTAIPYQVHTIEKFRFIPAVYHRISKQAYVIGPMIASSADIRKIQRLKNKGAFRVMCYPRDERGHPLPYFEILEVLA